MLHDERHCHVLLTLFKDFSSHHYISWNMVVSSFCIWRLESNKSSTITPRLGSKVGEMFLKHLEFWRSKKPLKNLKMINKRHSLAINHGDSVQAAALQADPSGWWPPWPAHCRSPPTRQSLQSRLLYGRWPQNQCVDATSQGPSAFTSRRVLSRSLSGSSSVPALFVGKSSAACQMDYKSM